jgi:hypothetical protein
MTDPRYTVLGKAASYQEAIDRSGRPQNRDLYRTLDEARASLIPQCARIQDSIRTLPGDHRLDEVLFELQLDASYLAKSYHPTELLAAAKLKLRGTGVWRQGSRKGTATRGRTDPTEETVDSRSLFVSGTDQAVDALKAAIATPATPRMESDVIGVQHIRLPSRDDRLVHSLATMPEPKQAVEIVLFAWDPVRRQEAVRRITDLITHGMGAGVDILVRSYTTGPTFIAAVISAALVDALGRLNFLRLARVLPRVTMTRTASGMTVQAPVLPRVTPPLPATVIAVFDGGVELTPHLKPYVQAFEETTRPAIPDLVDHGTGVVSAAVYGHIAPGGHLRAPSCRVLSYRVMPDALSSDLELYGVIDTLERIVPRLPAAVKVINLSIGPNGPIDAVPTRFTYAIDRLSYECDKLFVTAVGNLGRRAGLERIQAPADSVNNIAVGAYTRDPATGERISADYSCSGPGRAGCSRKPDILAFGGSASVPFYVLDSRGGTMTGTDGTSFAAPLVSAMCGNALARVDQGITTQAARALLLRAPLFVNGDPLRVGWGAVPESIDDLLLCTATRVSVLYEGTLTPRTSWKLPFLLPPSFDAGGDVHLSWTIVYCPDVDQAAHDEYTLAGIELQVRPHARRFMFTKRGTVQPAGPFDLDDHKDVIKGLVADGWKRSLHPVSASNRRLTEHTLRASEAKWDTVVRDSCGKRSSSIKESMLTISLLGRGDWDAKDASLQARFAAVLTVDAPKYKGDLYQNVMKSWNRLRPLVLRPDNTISINA